MASPLCLDTAEYEFLVSPLTSVPKLPVLLGISPLRRPGVGGHLMPQPFLAIGRHPAGHGFHRHDRHEGRLSWVW